MPKLKYEVNCDKTECNKCEMNEFGRCVLFGVKLRKNSRHRYSRSNACLDAEKAAQSQKSFPGWSITK